jgi:multidrug resistance efflux pump
MIMGRLNLFYIAILITGITLFAVLRPDFNRDLSFYGFAESNETEINYNYPVVVDKILVNPGQEVKAGEVMMHLSRRKSKETLEDQSFRIAELNAEEAIWRQKKESEIEELAFAQQTRISEITGKIERTQNELKYKKSLLENLKSIEPAESSYRPLEEELESLNQEKVGLNRTYDLKIEGIKKELDLGRSPYREQIKRLTAEQAFDESQKIQEIIVTAPTDGLVGNIMCKEDEHIPSYTTLLSYYEPHSGIIKGFVHEDLTLEVEIGDLFEITSLKDETINYQGTVIGLGSRIVEIPTRLRKIQEIKSYGREVLIEISKENSFLQKEKVSINFTQ